MFVLTTLKTGEKFISEFTKLRGLRSYSSQVMSGQKSFAAWTVVAREHPASGEPCLVRTRTFVSGTAIATMTEVAPTTEDHEYDPENFKPVEHFQKNEYGFFQFTDALAADIEGAVAGIEYPIHRDPTSLRKYVILSVAEPENSVEEQRHYIDSATNAWQPISEVDDDDEDERAEVNRRFGGNRY